MSLLCCLQTVVISLDYLTAFKHVEHDTEEYWALRSKVGEPFGIEVGTFVHSRAR